MERTISSFQYHIYTTMHCSLSCQHCFIDSEVRDDKTQMTVEQFKKVVDLYTEHFAGSDADKAEVTIIGGEPTLLKASFYLEVMPYLKQKFEETGKFFYTAIVTNFMHTKNLMKFDHLFDCVTTSYEPLRFSEYNLRANAEQKGDIWVKNVKSYIESGKRLAVSITTTKDVIEAGPEMLEYLMTLGIYDFQLNQSVPEGDMLKNMISEDDLSAHHLVRKAEQLVPTRNRKIFTLHEEKENTVYGTFDQESDYMIAITKWYIQKRREGIKLSVYPIESYAEGLANEVVIDDIACGISRGLNTRMDGNTTGCATEIGSKEMLSYGNVFESTAEDINNSEIRQKHISATKRIHRECITCEYNRNCVGACMLRAKMWDSKDPNAECHGLKRYLKYVEENFEEIREVRDASGY